MSNDGQNLRHQLDAPMRKVRADLGLAPLDGLDKADEHSAELLVQANQLVLLCKNGVITTQEARAMLGSG